ncbi:MAG: SHOCT domain-containing protein [Oxalobacteraceae bacterium]|nr:MAG: SHOCT domain-containing protein [Oxalobacteraceae bacterium]
MAVDFSEDGRQAISAIASRHGFGVEAAEAMAKALLAGNGRMAQFSHPELGGMGQWSQGGMLMIGDMFNSDLKTRVGGLADDLASAMADGSLARKTGAGGGNEADTSDRHAGDERGTAATGAGAVQSSNGASWPAHLGTPSASGSQNGRRYAIFAASHRIAVEEDGKVRLYDTGDHDISGVSQAQGSANTLRLNARNGSLDLSELKEVEK